MTTLASGTTSPPEMDETETATAERDRLSEDEVFHVLQNQRRRWVLKFLEGEDEEVRMRDVAEQVAAWEHDTTVQALDSTQRQRVYIPLYQNHLPKLDELGIIEYNQSRGIVRRTELADQLHPYLDPFDYGNEQSTETDEEFSWELPYLGVAGIGALLVVGKAWSLPLLSLTPDSYIGVLILLLFTATSGAQIVSQRVLDS